MWASLLATSFCIFSWKFKWPGRVGDAPMIGSGLYCDGTVGAAVATGDGEEVSITELVLLLCFLTFLCRLCEYAYHLWL